MDFEIVTQGSRLRGIREKLGLKQEHLSGDSITRNLVSMVETDKAPLTPKAAEVVIENLKKYVDDNDKDMLREIEELRITGEEQAKEIFKRFNKYVQEVGIEAEKDLKTMLDILTKYHLEIEKVSFYYDFGMAFEKVQMYTKAYKYFSLSREFAEVTEQYGEQYGDIIMHLLHACNRLKMFTEGIFISKGINSDMPLNTYARIMYNLASLYKANKQYDEAFNVIDFEKVFNKHLKNENLMTKAKLLTINCYRDKGHYNRALSMYKELYNKINNRKRKKVEEITELLILGSMIETNLIMEDTSYREYLDKLVNLISTSKCFEEDYTSAEICKCIYQAFSKINEEEQANEYLLKALDLGKRHKNYDVVEFVITVLFDRAVIHGENEVDEVKREVLELLSLGLIHRNSNLVLLIIQYYIKCNSHKALGVIEYCTSKIS